LPGDHDDYSNAAAGAIVGLETRPLGFNISPEAMRWAMTPEPQHYNPYN
jgi:hypothetical protein